MKIYQVIRVWKHQKVSKVIENYLHFKLVKDIMQSGVSKGKLVVLHRTKKEEANMYKIQELCVIFAIEIGQ